MTSEDIPPGGEQGTLDIAVVEIGDTFMCKLLLGEKYILFRPEVGQEVGRSMLKAARTAEKAQRKKDGPKLILPGKGKKKIILS